MRAWSVGVTELTCRIDAIAVCEAVERVENGADDPAPPGALAA